MFFQFVTSAGEDVIRIFKFNNFPRSVINWLAAATLIHPPTDLSNDKPTSIFNSLLNTNFKPIFNFNRICIVLSTDNKFVLSDKSNFLGDKKEESADEKCSLLPV